MKLLFTAIALFWITYSACGPVDKPQDENTEAEMISKADQILNKALEAHGSAAYDNAHYEFIFRERRYEFKNGDNSFWYSRTTTLNDSIIVDVLDNGKLSRTINGNLISLSEKDSGNYRESVNSVIYFATLPHKLLDPAVNLTYIATQSINGIDYEVLKITFDEEGGGEDFDDEYHYWVHKSDHTIDYLAYNYTVNGGGVRFRSAYNDRIVDGILFQDYINYKAPVGTPLIELPALLQKGELKELSRIETEEVRRLR